jgi:hypothetical protein
MDKVDIPPEERQAFRDAMEALKHAGIRFVVAGAFSLYHYTGVWRYTKDLDLFLLPKDVEEALNVLRDMGYHTRIEAENWLAKAFKRSYMIDLIYGEGNWLHHVDEEWFRRGKRGTVLGVRTLIAPIEEVIHSKAYVADRGRFDGADIVHLIRASGGKLDWRHLYEKFGEHWELLFHYVTLFRFVYPSHKDYIPAWLTKELIARLKDDIDQPERSGKVCRGTLLDRLSYIHDVEEYGYHDPREEYAEALGYSVKDVLLERRWAAKKLHRKELHVA